MTTVPEKRGGWGEPDRPSFLAFLDWLPWEKILIWTLFLLAVYSLRDFFFIIFMTFILSYIMLGIVQRISRLLSPYKERIWLERILTIVCFTLLLAGVYLAGNYRGSVAAVPPGTSIFTLVVQSIFQLLTPFCFGYFPLSATSVTEPKFPVLDEARSLGSTSSSGSGVGVGTGSKSSHRGSHSSHLVSASVV